MRFWPAILVRGAAVFGKRVSTLLEILARRNGAEEGAERWRYVSTLLEILVTQIIKRSFSLTEKDMVSTLLEILARRGLFGSGSLGG